MEFLMELLKLILIGALFFLGLGCIGYVIGYGFHQGKKDVGDQVIHLKIADINVRESKNRQIPDEDDGL